MDILQEIVASPLFWWIIVLLAIAKEKRNAVLNEVAKFSTQTVEHGVGKSLVQKSGSLYHYTGIYNLVDDEKLTSAIQVIVGGLGRIAKSVDDAISRHAKSIAEVLGKPEERAWKILGYLLQLVLLVAFFIADIIQTLNSLIPFYPDELASFAYLLEYLPLPLAIVMASVGTALALGIIISDFAGVTKFGDWNNLTGWYRGFIQLLTYVTLVVAITIAVVINLSKVVSIPGISATLTANFIRDLIFWAGIAQNIVIFPLYATTLLFFSGLKGFQVLYLIIIYLVIFIIKVIHGCIWVITVLVMKGGTKGIEIAIKLSLLGLAAILIALGSIFMGGGGIVAFLLTLVQKILEFVFFPADVLFEKLWNKLKIKEEPSPQPEI